jgi:predicted HTH domain antitoxin
MPVTIPDDILRQAGLSEREALIEIACRLYDAGRLEQPDAVSLCGLTRPEFWDALRSRGLAWMRVDEADVAGELEVLARLGSKP